MPHDEARDDDIARHCRCLLPAPLTAAYPVWPASLRRGERPCRFVHDAMLASTPCRPALWRNRHSDDWSSARRRPARQRIAYPAEMNGAICGLSAKYLPASPEWGSLRAFFTQVQPIYAPEPAARRLGEYPRQFPVKPRWRVTRGNRTI